MTRLPMTYVGCRGIVHEVGKDVSKGQAQHDKGNEAMESNVLAERQIAPQGTTVPNPAVVEVSRDTAAHRDLFIVESPQ